MKKIIKRRYFNPFIWLFAYKYLPLQTDKSIKIAILEEVI